MSDWPVKAFNYSSKIYKGIDSSYEHRSDTCDFRLFPKKVEDPRRFSKALWKVSGNFSDQFPRISEDSRRRPKNFEEFKEDPDPKISFWQNCSCQAASKSEKQKLKPFRLEQCFSNRAITATPLNFKTFNDNPHIVTMVTVRTKKSRQRSWKSLAILSEK